LKEGILHTCRLFQDDMSPDKMATLLKETDNCYFLMAA